MKVFTCIILTLHVANAGLLKNTVSSLPKSQNLETIAIFPGSNSFSSSGASDESLFSEQQKEHAVEVVRSSGGSSGTSIFGGFNKVNGDVITSSSSSSIIDENLFGGSITGEIHHNLGVLPVGHTENVRSIRILEEPLQGQEKIKTIRILEQPSTLPEEVKTIRISNVQNPLLKSYAGLEDFNILEQPEYLTSGKTLKIVPDNLELKNEVQTIQIIEEPVEGVFEKSIQSIQVLEQPTAGYQHDKVIRVVCNGENYNNSDFQQIIKLLADNGYLK